MVERISVMLPRPRSSRPSSWSCASTPTSRRCWRSEGSQTGLSARCGARPSGTHFGSPPRESTAWSDRRPSAVPRPWCTKTGDCAYPSGWSQARSYRSTSSSRWLRKRGASSIEHRHGTRSRCVDVASRRGRGRVAGRPVPDRRRRGAGRPRPSSLAARPATAGLRARRPSLLRRRRAVVRDAVRPRQHHRRAANARVRSVHGRGDASRARRPAGRVLRRRAR